MLSEAPQEKSPDRWPGRALLLVAGGWPPSEVAGPQEHLRIVANNTVHHPDIDLHLRALHPFTELGESPDGGVKVSIMGPDGLAVLARAKDALGQDAIAEIIRRLASGHQKSPRGGGGGQKRPVCLSAYSIKWVLGVLLLPMKFSQVIGLVLHHGSSFTTPGPPVAARAPCGVHPCRGWCGTAHG